MYNHERKVSTYVRPKFGKLTVAYAYVNGLSKSEVGEMAIEKLFNTLPEGEVKNLMQVYDKLTAEEKSHPRNKNKNFY